MRRGVNTIAVTALSLLPLAAKAECKDLVMRMASPDGKREITTFFNCHGGSYQIPEATTTHFFEWKSGQLCQTTRVCGNVSAWRGTFGVGAVYTFGSSVTDFTQNAKYLTTSSGTAQPNYLNYIVANNGNVCLNTASNQVLTFQNSAGNSGSLNCYPKTMMGAANWQSAIDKLTAAGYAPTTQVAWNDQSVNFICAQGDQNNVLSSHNGVVNQANVQDCNSANINLNNSSTGASPVFNQASGYQKVNGSSDTDYNQLQLNVHFQMMWENIERYCKKPEAEVCY
jgi:hypothetical protein